jgi:choline dehydrogenase-like flavoprotein
MMGNTLPDALGIRFREGLTGFVKDTPTSETFLGLTLTVRIRSLRRFLEERPHVAEIEAGLVRWGGQPRVGAVRPGARIEFFPAAGVSRDGQIVYDLAFHDDVNGFITIRGVKHFDPARAADPVAALNELTVVARGGGSEFTGAVRGSSSAAIKQVQRPEILGAAGAGESQAAKEAFLGFVHGEVAHAYPGFPRPFQLRAALTPEAWYLLSIVASLFLPEPLPPNGPNLSEVLDNLETFLRESSGSQISRVGQFIDFIAAVIPLENVDRKELRDRVQRELKGSSTLLRQILQSLHLLIVFPYYAHRKGGLLVGYEPPVITPKKKVTLTIADAPPERVFDIAIVGSGPAGSLLAQRLSNAGKSVILLEQGKYTPEHTLTSDEIAATSRLYRESGLQQANAALLGQIFEPKEHPTFVVLQGSCVGGGAMINNAICFRLPSRRFSDWQGAGFPISQGDLDAGYSAVAAELSIGPVSTKVADPGTMLNPAPGYFSFEPSPLEECLVNFEDFAGGDSGCAGNGLCNIGCGAERKRNALQVYLPDAIGHGTVLVPEAAVEEVVTGAGAGKVVVDHLRVFLSRSGAHVRVRAKHFVLSAGAVASSYLLLRSPSVRAITDRGRLPVGKNFSANIDSAVFAVVPGLALGRTAVQMAHFVETGADAGFIVESWFAPPGMLAIAMPGFLDDHFRRMQSYGQTVGAAVLVGTETPGEITAEGDKAIVTLPIRLPETTRLRNGLAALVRAFLKGGRAGRPEVILVGFDGGREIRSEADVRNFERELTSLERLTLSTAHPQGGNALSTRGVLDTTFRVGGFENLRVCDASVFPLSAGVNPQWTVMALAHLCAAQMIREG